MRGWFVAIVLAACTDGGSSGTGDGGMSCPNDLPMSCPSHVPSYKSDVAPLFTSFCNFCHTPGGKAGDKPLVTYPEVKSLEMSCLNQIYSCRMPPSGSPPLDEAERQTLLT